jgi:hypothetical protein
MEDFIPNEADLAEQQAESARLKALIESVRVGGVLVAERLETGYVERLYSNQKL